MKRLADEILAALPGMMLERPNGPNIGEIATWVGADRGDVKLACEALADEGQAIFVRRAMSGGPLCLLPLGDPIRACIICRREFTSTKRETRTCSRSCAKHLGWRHTDREHHREAIRRSRNSPAVLAAQEKMTAERRTPEYRAMMSERNLRQWQDPEIRTRRLVAVREAWQRPERRKANSERRKAHWQDTDFRERAVAAMRASKRGERKRQIIAFAVANQNLSTSEIGKRFGCSRDCVGQNLRDARREGLIGVRPGDGPQLRCKAGVVTAPKRRQSADHVRKRIASAWKTRKAQREGAPA